MGRDGDGVGPPCKRWTRWCGVQKVDQSKANYHCVSMESHLSVGENVGVLLGASDGSNDGDVVGEPDGDNVGLRFKKWAESQSIVNTAMRVVYIYMYIYTYIYMYVCIYIYVYNSHLSVGENVGTSLGASDGENVGLRFKKWAREMQSRINWSHSQ